MIVIFYATGFLATFFGLKFHKDFKERTWENVYDRFICGLIFPISLGFYIATFQGATNKPNPPKIKPPKWL